jgi:ABC-type antimicrobial peptide transport system permease subunit
MVSYAVSRRTREMGIRLALGADRGGVVRLVLRGGLAFVVAGAAIGIAASLALGRFVEGFLYGVSGMDPVALVAAPLVLGVVATCANYLPARRASRVNPVETLRTE